MKTEPYAETVAAAAAAAAVAAAAAAANSEHYLPHNFTSASHSSLNFSFPPTIATSDLYDRHFVSNRNSSKISAPS